MRVRPLNRTKSGDHLVTTADGDVVYASETAVERIGPRTGLLVHRGDLDDPGRFEIRQRYRHERPVSPVTGEPRKIWRVWDQAGDVVPGGPADV